MPQYCYTALSQNGALMVGEHVAASLENLKADLEKRGLRVRRIRIKRNRAIWQRRVSTEEFLLFVQELLSCMDTGLPLPEALALTADRPGEPVLGPVLQRILREMEDGVLFSKACAAHPDVFDGFFLAALKTGEKTGELSVVLSRYLDFLRRQIVSRRKVS